MSLTFDKIYESYGEMIADKDNIWPGRFVLVKSVPTNKIFTRTFNEYEEVIFHVDSSLIVSQSLGESETSVISQKSATAALITNKTSGTYGVALTDISPIEQILKVKATSKNLFDINNPMFCYPNDYSINFPITIIDGVIYSGGRDGESEGASLYIPNPKLPFSISFDMSGDYENDINKCLICEFDSLNEQNVRLNNVKIRTDIITSNHIKIENISSDKNFISIGWWGVSEKSLAITNLQIEVGTIATDYVPHDVSIASIKKYGKNLLDYSKYAKTGSHNGVTFTKKGDDGYTVNGTAGTEAASFTITSDVQIRKNLIPGVAYRLSGGEKLPSNAQLYLRYQDPSKVSPTVRYSSKNETPLVWDSSYTFERIYLYINAGISVNNIDVYPQLEIGTSKTNYEPYKKPIIYTPNTDGTVEGITSLYPVTTLISNTQGIVLDVEYKVDTKKYIDNKFAELAATIVNS